MSSRKAKPQMVAPKPASAPAAYHPKKSAPPRQAATTSSQPATVSGRWLLQALSAVLGAAAVCAWGVLCLLFWQGSWQLLYHPSAPVARTPAARSIPFDFIGFAATDSGLPQLSGWWIPAAPSARNSHFTVLYLHGEDGNLGGSVDHLAQLHEAGLNVFAFDYRGYGQSQFIRPSETHWLEDATSALGYLTLTRHISAGAIVLDGSDLGANLALEFAVAHPQLAGVIIESPLAEATGAIFNDPRARLVPARLLVRDRYDTNQSAAGLRIPSLWFFTASGAERPAGEPAAYRRVPARKMLVWLPPASKAAAKFTDGLSRWLGELTANSTTGY